MKTNITLFCVFVCLCFITSCIKEDCERKPTYQYFPMAEQEKLQFPYRFTDTLVWINVNTLDTLHYVLKDTMSDTDSLAETSIEECSGDHYSLFGKYTYNFVCLENTAYNMKHSYRKLITEHDYDPILFFNKRNYTWQYQTADSIVNFNTTYYKILVASSFCHNNKDGLLRITIGSTKLYRIK